MKPPTLGESQLKGSKSRMLEFLNLSKEPWLLKQKQLERQELKSLQQKVNTKPAEH